jgi:hypothetical protein
MALKVLSLADLTRLCGIFFVLAFAVFFVGGMMFWARMGGMPLWATPFANSYIMWERIFVMSAVILTVPGMMLLEEIFRSGGGGSIGRLGTYGYIFAAIFILTAEALGLQSASSHYPLIILYVVLAFLAQMLIGMGLLGTGIVPGWMGWFAILWNLAWLIILPLFSPRDIYFPVVHHVIPLFIGLYFLMGSPR